MTTEVCPFCGSSNVNLDDLGRNWPHYSSLIDRVQVANAKLAEALRAVLAGYSPYTAITEETLHEAGKALAEHDQSKQ